MKKIITTITILLLLPAFTFGQKVAIKTNALYLATTTPNLSVEWAPSTKITLDLQGSYNGWDFGSEDSNRKIKHWMIQPEIRFWIYEPSTDIFLVYTPSIWNTTLVTSTSP